MEKISAVWKKSRTRRELSRTRRELPQSGAPDAKLSVNYATYLTTVTKGKLGTYTYNLSRYIVQRQINYMESETVEIDTKKEEVPT